MPVNRVAILGTGILGAELARRLARAGAEVTVWNRTPTRAAAIAAEVHRVAETPADAALGAAVVVTALADGAAIDETATGPEGFLAGVAPRTVWWQAGTIGLYGLRRAAVLADTAGVRLVDGPVFGVQQPDGSVTYTVLLSGEPADLDTIEPLLAGVAEGTMRCGRRGDASRLKLAVNSWRLALVVGLAESLTLAEGLGVEASLLLDAIARTGLDSPYAHVKGDAMMRGEFPPRLRLAVAAKDAGLVVDAAQEARLRLPQAEAHEMLLGDAASAFGDEDVAAVVRSLRDPPSAG